jgi:hypothetical protein
VLGGTLPPVSSRQRLIALVVAVTAALLCLAIAGRADTSRDRNESIYICNVWNDRAWAGCP